MRLKELRKKGLDEDLRYFLQLEQLSTSKVMRWIEYCGWIIERPDQHLIIILSQMGSSTHLIDAMMFETKKDCLFMKDKLNSEIVKEYEPDNWLPTWKQTDERTHKEVMTDSKLILNYQPCWECGCKTYSYNQQELESDLFRVRCTDCNRVLEGERAKSILTECGLIEK